MQKFILTTSFEKMEHLLEEYAEFRACNLPIRKAYNLSIQAWHLIDWVFNEHVYDRGSRIAKTKQLTAFRNTLYPLCENLRIMHDLATEHKHSEVENPLATIRILTQHSGTFNQSFSKEFDIATITIRLQDRNLDFVETIESVITFWREYFKNNIKLTDPNGAPVQFKT